MRSSRRRLPASPSSETKSRRVKSFDRVRLVLAKSSLIGLVSRAAVTALAAVVGGVLALGLVNVLASSEQRMDVRLASSGSAVDGTVTGSFPLEHGSIEYKFEAAGRSFSGAGHVSGSNPRPAQLRPGDKVRIVYDPTDPQVSCACSPRDDLDNARRNNLALALFGGFAAGVIAFMALTKRAMTKAIHGS